MENQTNPVNGTDKIESLLDSESHAYTKTFKGQPFTDPHVLIRSQRTLSCKAHHLSLNGNSASYPPDIELKPEYLHPYGNVINAFSWTMEDLRSIPDDIFGRLKNLQCFFLVKAQLKENPVIPVGLGNCKQLETIELSDLGISSLPKDILLGPSLNKVMHEVLILV